MSGGLAIDSAGLHAFDMRNKQLLGDAGKQYIINYIITDLQI